MFYVVFSDLDGTLLDHDTYSFAAALPALRALRRLGFPLVLCSSKTRREIEVVQRHLDLADPFIAENGGAIWLAPSSLPFVPEGALEAEGRLCIPLGTPYARLREALSIAARETGARVTGFGDLTVADVSRLTGLDAAAAALALRREFDEPFLLEGSVRQKEQTLRALERMGLRHTVGGRFYHVMGESDKGRAVRIVASWYRRLQREIITIGLGDSENDFPLLAAVDRPILVERPGGGYAQGLAWPRLQRAPGRGPRGWNAAVLAQLGAC